MNSELRFLCDCQSLTSLWILVQSPSVLVLLHFIEACGDLFMHSSLKVPSQHFSCDGKGLTLLWPSLGWALAVGQMASVYFGIERSSRSTQWLQEAQIISPTPPCWQLEWGGWWWWALWTNISTNRNHAAIFYNLNLLLRPLLKELTTSWVIDFDSWEDCRIVLMHINAEVSHWWWSVNEEESINDARC